MGLIAYFWQTYPHLSGVLVGIGSMFAIWLVLLVIAMVSAAMSRT